MKEDLFLLKTNEPTEFHIDFSRINTYMECPKKYAIEYIKHLRSDGGSDALRFGTVFHGMLEGFYTVIKKEGWNDNAQAKAFKVAVAVGRRVWEIESEGLDFHMETYRTMENCIQMLIHYLGKPYGDQSSMEILETESVFCVSMEHETELERKLFPDLKSFFLEGRIDLKCKIGGALTILDHKTSGWALSNIRKKANKNPQNLTYAYGTLRTTGLMPVQAITNFAYCKSVKSKVTGNYGKLSLDFDRFPSHFSEEDVSMWRLTIFDIVTSIQKSLKTGYWPAHFGSCHGGQYGTSCQFAFLCEQAIPFEDLNLEGYRHHVWNPKDQVDIVSEILKEEFKD